jgi:hypothetical protein
MGFEKERPVISTKPSKTADAFLLLSTALHLSLVIKLETPRAILPPIPACLEIMAADSAQLPHQDGLEAYQRVRVNMGADDNVMFSHSFQRELSLSARFGKARR